jgi:hypothetical protein
MLQAKKYIILLQYMTVCALIVIDLGHLPINQDP